MYKKINIILTSFLILSLFLVPATVRADSSLRVGDTSFQYDGSEKYLKVINIPDKSAEDDVSWTLIPEGMSSVTYTGSSISIGDTVTHGEYSVKINDTDFKAQGNYVIKQRPISIKPVDIREEFIGQTLIPDRIEYISGSLVSGHVLTTSLSGTNNKIGEEKSRITEYSVSDSQGKILTDNYSVSTFEGKLILTEPFVVTTDPETQGVLGGGKTAKPKNQSSSSSSTISTPKSQAVINNVENSENSLAEINAESQTPVETETDEQTILDNQTPLDSGQTEIKDNPIPLASEVNNTLGIALFVALFLIVAIIVIYFISRQRNKVKEQIYD